MCRRCGVVEEDSLHVLYDCFHAVDLWRSAVSTNNRVLFFASDLKEWIQINMVSNMGWNDDHDWRIFWANACYNIWK